MLGREVAALISETLKSGIYETKFDGGGLGDGVYFYRLSAGDYRETKRMILLK